LALIEILICSSICAMMLTATAVAFKASLMAYRDNTDRNMLLSNGRVAMRQLINEIRQADAHGPINDTLVPNATSLFASGLTIENAGIAYLKTYPDVDDPGIVHTTPSTHVLITWQYDAANNQLLRTHSVNGVSTTAIAANYVSDFKVRMEPARSPANVASGNTSFDLLLRAVVTMSLQNVDASGNMINNRGTTFVTERLVDAAVPRKSFNGL